MGLADSLLHLDRLSRNRPYPTLEPKDLTSAIVAYSQNHAPSSIRTTVLCWRTYYTWLHEGDLSKRLHKRASAAPPRVIREMTPISGEELLCVEDRCYVGQSENQRVGLLRFRCCRLR
jgi:hypothetical protein